LVLTVPSIQLTVNNVIKVGINERGLKYDEDIILGMMYKRRATAKEHNK